MTAAERTPRPSQTAVRPPDADTTSVALYALARLGAPTDLECLWRYETEAGFCTWPREDGFSVTTNAHVLDALVQRLSGRRYEPRYREVTRRLVAALQSHQQPDGSWQDRWHASPYYATMCCSLALGEVAGRSLAGPVARAAEWVASTQRADGSWGRWEGTAEETAYAVQILVAAGRPRMDASVSRGRAYLLTVGQDGPEGPALWHDKDLYRPHTIVRAAVLAALHLSNSELERDPEHLSASGA